MFTYWYKGKKLRVSDIFICLRICNLIYGWKKENKHLQLAKMIHELAHILTYIQDVVQVERS